MNKQGIEFSERHSMSYWKQNRFAKKKKTCDEFALFRILTIDGDAAYPITFCEFHGRDSTITDAPNSKQ